MASAGTPSPELDGEVIRKIRGDFRFVLLHAGNLGFYGAWATLIEAARQLAGDGIGLVFVGEGAQRAEVESLAADVPNVRFLPFFPGSKLDSVLAAPDAHIITVKRGLEGVVVPSKMYGILAAGKPVVAVAPQETDAVTLSRRWGFGIGVDPESPAEVAKAIREMAAAPMRLVEMGAAAKRSAANFQRSDQLLKFAAVLESVAKR